MNGFYYFTEKMELLFFAFALTLYYILHSILAHNKVKATLMKNIIKEKYYRLCFNAFAIFSLLGIFILYKKTSSHFLFQHTTLNYFGIGLSIIGIALLVIALLQYNLGEFSGVQQLKNNSTFGINELKTSGFNSLVRHPLYFATLCILWGYFLFHPTDLFLVTAFISTLYLYFGTKLEEQKLIEEFGEAYKIYQKRVKMLIPYIF